MEQNRAPRQNEVLFICYEDVIKTVKPFLLKKLQEPQYKEKYADLIDYTEIDGKSDDDLLTLSMSFYYKNIFQDLKKKEFDYDKVYDDFSSQFDNLMKDSELLVMGKSLKVLLSQKFMKQVYIYIDRPDKRILVDLIDTYDDEKIKLVVGNFTEGVSLIKEKITLFVLNDISMIDKLEEANKLTGACVLVANLGYNYTLIEETKTLKFNYDEEKEKKYNFNLGKFSII